MVSLDKITLGAVAGAGTNLVVGGIGRGSPCEPSCS